MTRKTEFVRFLLDSDDEPGKKHVLVDSVLEVNVASLEGLAGGGASGDAEGSGTEEHGHGG